ncbi:hypothetical protein [Lactobacillus intestinalis]|uniref:hypothetical protein n=1 Tax=Lactobacillus intestinalis TaxID=151781 RepID=UPI0026F2EC60|nr:hypothetical protein [Lactobacillus intestinalis]
MLTKNKKNNFKTQAILMTLGTLAPMSPAMMSNFGNVVAHADSTAVPVPERLTTPSDEDFPLLPFTWTIKVVNQQNGQTLKTDDITFTPSKDYTIDKDGGTTVHYKVTDTAGIFKSDDYKVDNGDINFNDILNKNNNGSIRGNKSDSLADKGTFENWVFGAKNSDGLTPYILPQLNDPNTTNATQQAEVSGTADHKVLTFYVIPNTAQTKNKTNNNSGSYVVPATGQDTGNNTATANGSDSTTNTSSNTNNGSATNNNSTNANKANNAGNDSHQSSQQDADTQQIINAINQHAVNSNDKLPSDAKLLEQAPSNTNGFNSYSVQVSEKGTNGQITYKHLTVHYNPATKQFFVTEQGQNAALTKAQLLQIFGLQSKDGNNVAGTNGVASSGNLDGTTTGGSTSGLAQTNVQTKQNASILLSAIVGTAVLGFGLTKDGKLKL